MSETYYKIEIDGYMMLENFETFDKALESAHLYFAGDNTLTEAKIFRMSKELVGATFNKKAQCPPPEETLSY